MCRVSAQGNLPSPRLTRPPGEVTDRAWRVINKSRTRDGLQVIELAVQQLPPLIDYASLLEVEHRPTRIIQAGLAETSYVGDGSHADA